MTDPHTPRQWHPGDAPQQPAHWPQHYPTIIIASSRPRQSCALHLLLACTTLGVGNIAYAIWHNRRYNP